MTWMVSMVLATAALLMVIGLALMLDAGVHLARVLRAEDRSRLR